VGVSWTRSSASWGRPVNRRAVERRQMGERQRFKAASNAPSNGGRLRLGGTGKTWVMPVAHATGVPFSRKRNPGPRKFPPGERISVGRLDHRANNAFALGTRASSLEDTPAVVSGTAGERDWKAPCSRDPRRQERRCPSRLPSRGRGSARPRLRARPGLERRVRVGGPAARAIPEATGLFRTTGPLRPARHGNVEPRAGSRAAIVLPSGQPKRGAPS
jgi:hypothetical protein